MGSATKQQSSSEQDQKESREKVSGIALGATEAVQHDLRPSWTNYSKSLAFFWTVVTLVWAWYDRWTTRYIVTTERLIIKHGSLLGKVKTDEYELANVERIETKQSYLGRLFGAGAITAHMRHKHHEAEPFTLSLPLIPNYEVVAQTLREQGG